jgi:hypothetical protein
MCGTLNVILPTQRVDASATPADVSGQQGQIHKAHHTFGPLGMFRYSETMDAHGGFFSRIDARGFPD